VEVELSKRTHVGGLSLDHQRSSKQATVGRKQCKQLRTLNASQMTNSMRNSMYVSAVYAIFGLPLSVLHFVSNPHTRVCLGINFTELNFQFLQ